MLIEGFRGVARSTVNPRPVALFRVLFGCLILLRGISLVEQLRLAGGLGAFAAGGDQGAVASVLVAACWFGLGAALAVGWHARYAAGLLATLIFGLLWADPIFYNNHLYLMGLVALLLAFVDCDAAFSRAAGGAPPPPAVAGWPVFLLKAQVSVVYAFAALSKFQEDFLSGYALHVHLGRGPFAHLLPAWLLGSFPLLAFTATAVVVVQAVLAWALWVPRWRGTAFVLGVALHAPMVLLADTNHQAVRLVLFSMLMCGLYLLFLPVPTGGHRLCWDPRSPTVDRIVRACRRLDVLEALTWAPSDGSNPEGGTALIELTDPGGRVHTGFRAVQQTLCLLPLTYLWAPLLGNRVVLRWGDAALSSAAPRPARVGSGV